MKLKNRRNDPSKGWRYRTDEGVEFKEQLFDLLVFSVVQHYTANERFGTTSGINKDGKKIFTRDEIIVAIEQQICENSPPGHCLEDTRPVQLRITLEKLIEVSRSLISLYSSSDKITLNEADARASICLSCPHNTSYWAKCWTCNAAHSLVSYAVKTKSTFDKHLYLCDLCGCVLGVKIFIPAKAIKELNAPKGKDFYPPSCWIYKIIHKIGS